MQVAGIRIEVDGAQRAESDLRRVRGSVEGVGDAATSIRSALGGLAAAFAGAFSVQQFFQAADAVTQLRNSLALSTGSATAAAQAYEELFGVAQRSRVSFIDLGNTYSTIARATQGLGISQRDLLTVTEALGNAIAIGGGRAESTRAALIQLTQGLASGALRGEELNSVLEQTPRVAKAIADGLGITIGQLREYGREGRLSSEAVVTALLRQSDVLRNEVGSSVVTVGQGFTVLGNAFTRFVGQVDQATGASSAVARALIFVAGNIEVLTAAAGTLIASGLAVWLASALPAAIAATKVALIALTGPIGLAVAAATALAVGIAAVWRTLSDGSGRLSKAEAELNSLREALERQPNNLMLRQMVKDQEAVVDRLRQTSGAARENDAELARLGARQSARQAQLREEAALQQTVADAERQRAGQNKEFTVNLEKLFAAYKAGVISVEQYRELVADLIQREGGGKKITDERAASMKKLGEEYGKLAESAQEYLNRATLELDLGAQLNDAQKQQLRIGEFLAANAGKLTAARVAELQQIILQISRIDQEKRSRDAVNESLKAAAKAQEELYTSAQRNVEQAVGRVRQLEDERRAADLAARTNISLAAALEEVAIARLKERQEVAAMVGDGRLVEQLGREIAARERIRDLILDKDTRDAQAKAAEDAAKAWQKASDDIEKALTDALVRGFESGKGVLRSVGDWILNYFKSTIARGIAQTLISALSSIGGRAGSGILGGLGSLFSGGAAAAPGGGGIGSLGSIISLISGGSSFGAGLMGGLFGGGGLGGSLSAAWSLLTSGSMAGAGAGLGMAVGAIAPYAAAVYGLYRIISGVGTGRDRSPARQSVGLVDALGRDLGLGEFAPFARNGGVNAGMVNTAAGIASTVAQTARALGGSINEALQFGLFTSVSPDGRGGQVVGGVRDRNAQWSLWLDRQVGNAQVEETLQSYVPRMILAGLQASNLPNAIREYLNTVNATTGSEEQINQVIQTALAVKSMTDAVASAGGVFARLADLSVDARLELANLTGGIDSFLQKVGGFVQEYYTEGERVGITARQIQATLRAAGITADFSTREQFRAALEGVDLSSEEGRRQLAALLNAASSFASISDYLRANNLTLGGAAALSPAGALAEAISAQTSDTQAQTDTLVESLTLINETFTDRLTGVEEQLETLRTESTASNVSSISQLQRIAEGIEEILVRGIPQAA